MNSLHNCSNCLQSQIHTLQYIFPLEMELLTVLIGLWKHVAISLHITQLYNRLCTVSAYAWLCPMASCGLDVYAAVVGHSVCDY